MGLTAERWKISRQPSEKHFANRRKNISPTVGKMFEKYVRIVYNIFKLTETRYV